MNYTHCLRKVHIAIMKQISRSLATHVGSCTYGQANWRSGLNQQLECKPNPNPNSNTKVARAGPKHRF